MKTGEKIAWTFIGLLIIGALTICFLLNLWLGISTLLITIGAFAFAYKGKGRIDQTIASAATELGLKYHPSRLTYGSITGEYNGYQTEITPEGGSDHMGTVTSFTRIKMRAGYNLGMRESIEHDDLKITVYDNEAYIDLSYLCTDPEKLREYLDKLSGFIRGKE